MIGNLIKARTFAAVKHQLQKDDDGNDYYMHHLVPVCEALIVLTNDEEVLMAGILHDVLEDTDTTYEELVKEFGKRVADLVDEVTDEGKADSYGKYFPRLKSKDAIMIKLIDRASNISRMGSWNEKRKQHYLNKTKFWKDGHDMVKDFSKVIDKSGLRGKKITPLEPKENKIVINYGVDYPTQQEVEKAIENHDKENKKYYRCQACKMECKNAEGIGEYCANPYCENLDWGLEEYSPNHEITHQEDKKL